MTHHMIELSADQRQRLERAESLDGLAEWDVGTLHAWRLSLPDQSADRARVERLLERHEKGT